MQITKYLLWLIASITLLMSSCTHNYVYDIENSVWNYCILDDGFHEMSLGILKKYGASTVYHQREKSIIELDKKGAELSVGHLIHVGDLNGMPMYGVQGRIDLSSEHTVSTPNASYLIIRVAMNAGEMGYICTDPIELKPGGVNEIILDANTPVHVELNVSEKSLPTR